MKSASAKKTRSSRKRRKPDASDGRRRLRRQEKEQTRQAWIEFVSFLKRRAHRVTTSRRIVLERVFERHDHFRADELAGDLSTGPNRVSRGTIYRTLALMVEAGLVREIRDADVHAHYEHVFGHDHHEHMICRTCGAFGEFNDPVIARRLDRVCRTENFRQTSHRIVVFGTCLQCRRRSDTPPSPS